MSKKQKPLYHPKYWLFWLIIGFLWLLAKLPYRVLLKMGAGMGNMIRCTSTKTRKIVEINLQLCFPELAPAERENLLKKNFESMCIALFEMALAWWAPGRKLQSMRHVHGLEHLENALKKGKGVIFCSAHFLSLELCGRLFSLKTPFAVMYRPQKQPVLDKLARYYRAKFYERVIAREDLRGMLKYLKSNGVVWYTPDIDGGLKNSIFLPFMGVEAATITMTARLATISGAEVVPIFCYRRDDGSGYDICIEPALENYPTGDVEADTLRINQIIETAIRKKPEQYLWQYKRFKTRPEGETRFY